MCNRDRADDGKRDGAFDWSVNRRQFALGAMGALAACASGPAGGGSSSELVEEWVRFPTPDGVMDASFVHPARGRHPAILTWPDIAGLREAYQAMARRLAAQGYAVLTLNNYYRQAPAPHFRDFADFAAQKGFEKVRPWVQALTADAIMRDAAAAIAWLDRRRAVDTRRGVGTHGYCLGGAHVVWTAAAVPERVGAAASLHGWRLVTDEPQSPHRLLARTRARHLFAIGENDDKEAPEEKNVLREAAAAAGRPAEVEVYPVPHGWATPDSSVYDPVQAERSWARMSALFAAL